MVRLIEKSDFGQMAMINVVIAFTVLFLDFGVSSGIIHKQVISNEELSTLYWLTIFLGGAFSCLLYLFSSSLATFYDEPALKFLIKLAAPLFIIQSIGQQYRVLLMKKLSFKLLSKMKLLTFFVSFITTITLAAFQFGVLALVVGRLAKATVEATLFVMFGRKEFTLHRRIDVKRIYFFLRFGAFQMGERLLNFFNRQIDVLLIGKFLGAEVLGVYDVIKRLLSRPFQLVNPIINKISFPILSRVQADDEKVKNYYLRQLGYICTLNFPIYLFLFFNAKMILVLILGQEWDAYEGIFMMLAFYFLIYSSGNPVGSLLLSRGLPDVGFYWNLITAVLISTLVFIGLNWGLLGTVGALLCGQCLLFIPNYYFLVDRAVKIPVLEYFKVLGVPFILGLLIGIGSFILGLVLPVPALIKIILQTSFAMASFLLLNRYFNPRFIGDLKLLLKR